MVDEFRMVPAQAFQLLGEIECGENCEISRINRLAVGTYRFNFFVNCRRQRARPFVTSVTGNGQLLAHDFDVDAFHRLSEIQAVKTSQDTFDAQFNLTTRVFVLP